MNFPLLLHNWASDEPLIRVSRYRTGMRMRWLGGDTAWLYQAFVARPGPDIPRRSAALLEFVADFGRRTGYDYIESGDLRPAAAAAGRAVREARRHVVRGARAGSLAEDTDVAVIGAGPYGLSISAHLTAGHVRNSVFGDPMEAWREHMPAGMHLKSEGFASNLSDPEGGHTLERYCAEHGLDYGAIAVPVGIDTFVGYGRWFQEALVPVVHRNRVERLRRQGANLELTLDSGDMVLARRVVVATGLVGYAHTPDTLAALPPDRVTHSYDHRNGFGDGVRAVAVVGAGQSALEGAVLLRDRGHSVRVVARTSRLAWNSKPGGRDRALRERIRRPGSGLGEGLGQWVYSNHPLAFHHLSARDRRRRAFAVLGPAGAWWLRPRFEGEIDTLLGRQVIEADCCEDGGVRLRLTGDASTSEIVVDHVLAATGYRPDLARVPFLDPSLLAEVATYRGTPVLDRAFESSVRRLHFVGYAAATSLGPLMRFVFGTEFASRRLARHAIERT